PALTPQQATDLHAAYKATHPVGATAKTHPVHARILTAMITVLDADLGRATTARAVATLLGVDEQTVRCWGSRTWQDQQLPAPNADRTTLTPGQLDEIRRAYKAIPRTHSGRRITTSREGASFLARLATLKAQSPLITSQAFHQSVAETVYASPRTVAAWLALASRAGQPPAGLNTSEAAALREAYEMIPLTYRGDRSITCIEGTLLRAMLSVLEADRRRIFRRDKNPSRLIAEALDISEGKAKLLLACSHRPLPTDLDPNPSPGVPMLSAEQIHSLKQLYRCVPRTSRGLSIHTPEGRALATALHKLGSEYPLGELDCMVAECLQVSAITARKWRLVGKPLHVTRRPGIDRNSQLPTVDKVGALQEITKIINALVARRHTEGLSQARLAQLLDLSTNAVIDMENQNSAQGPALIHLISWTHSLGLRMVIIDDQGHQLHEPLIQKPGEGRAAFEVRRFAVTLRKVRQSDPRQPTQATVARQAGVGLSSIRHWECGVTKPRMAGFIRWTLALECRIELQRR
ncbi:hypothetical protein, partial [Catenulispora yoronensis]|uniref:hypothetical protein n=1 Tax=Catenulispora yoronensis TaxID=450799 RepID=UPI0031DA7C0F